MARARLILTDVAAVVPTRGDVDLEPALGHLPFAEIGVWDNSTGDDLGVMGRYAAIANVDALVLYTQDDDARVPLETIEALLAAYEPDKVVCNVPAEFAARYRDSGLVGFGAVFDRDLPARAFARFRAHIATLEPKERERWEFHLRRGCDLVLTMLTPMVQLDLPVELLPSTYAPNRMSAEPLHYQLREQTRRMCREILALEAAA